MAGVVEGSKPKVHTHSDSGFRYLRGTDKVLFENGVYILRAEFEAIKNTAGAVKKRLEKSLTSEPKHCGFDWAYALDTGNLRRKKSAAQAPRIKRTRRQEQDGKDGQKKDTSHRQLFSSVSLVMAVMTVVGVGSAVMSAYHTAAFLYEGGKPLWAAFTTGTMLILFSGTAFSAARYFFKEGGPLHLFGALFVAAGLTVIAYSMFSTLTVNFNQFQWKDNEKTAGAVQNDEALLAHSRLLEENSAALGETSADILRLEGETDYWKTMSWKRYDEFNAELSTAKQRRDYLRSERARLETLTPQMAEAAAASRGTIYTFLARLLGLPEDVARFFVYIVPACLYDILAPFALSVVLLLLDKQKLRSDYGR